MEHNRNENIVMTGRVWSDGPTHLHFIRGADAYLYSITFCLVEIFCHEIFFGLFLMKVQQLLKSQILQFRS